ncbi:hypothetical protein [Mesorhizobium sp. B2-3-4]|uniref:hypothetical protein n=1 Tax=Mesorhizobium sp. B2-3-4 TaxID=2589959 RepID=UPI0011291AAA|nr:hypothetical protein [Mesorhizobium sp. B2-3-4]TPM41409.1 hypothetical protein FJ967_00280 [Mesorhizobium sp. B2-3-4]
MLADDDLIRAAPQEFSITPDLAMKMIPLFRYWRVSAEWTSREDMLKKISWRDDDGKLQSMPIRPDIIVHIPHTDEHNILVVEAKRIGNKDHAGDIRKLTLLTRKESADPRYHYGYRLGVHLIVDLPNRRIAGNDVYRNGQVEGDLTDLLWKLLH